MECSITANINIYAIQFIALAPINDSFNLIKKHNEKSKTRTQAI